MQTKNAFIFPEWPAPPNVKACITTRCGGGSLPPYSSNNLGLHVGDDEASVFRNRAQLCQHLGLKKTPQWLSQIHGVKVVSAKSDGLVRTADGVVTAEPGLACVVMSADCLPVLLCDKNAQGKATQVAALHCGWRSLSKGLCEKAIAKFKAPSANLVAYLGPAISQPHFEVGIDVLEAFFKSARTAIHADDIAAAFTPAPRPFHFYADIYALATAELRSLGVKQIFGGGYCTYAQPDHFYSFRRDGVTGRMASLIWLD